MSWRDFISPLPFGMAQPCETDGCILPEQRCLEFRQPGQLSPANPTSLGRPKTIADFDNDFEIHYLSLDEAIQIALANAEVIRVLNGTSVSTSGRTIYDPAVSNTDIDTQRATFDPVLEAQGGGTPGLSYGRTERLEQSGGAIIGSDTEAFNFNTSLSQTKTNGDMARLGFTTSATDFASALINPERRSAVELSYTRPLLRGHGTRVNLAPIVIARINTERSFYQLKDSVQELVRSVVDGYWSLVQARVELWARRQQVEQLEYAFKRLDAQRRVELADLGDTAQAKVSLEQFRANLITTEAQVLDLEAAFFNVMGLPPVPNMRLVPVTPPLRNRIDTEWEALVATASEQRPDIIELKLSIEAIQQQLIINCNNTLPQLDAVGLARTNSLSVNTPAGRVSSDPFQATDIQFGLNLRTPLGQRSARAALRQQELTLARERANLQQQLHATTHLLAQSIRSMEQFYRQYEAFQKVRDASKLNLDRRFEIVRVGGLPDEPLVYLDVLQAVTDWGNSVSSEAESLTRYNAEIANLERQAGVILRRHGIMFDEEGYQSLAPFGHCRDDCASYPQRTPPLPNQHRYEASNKAAEEAFDLTNPSPTDPQSRKRPNSETSDDDCVDILKRYGQQSAAAADQADTSKASEATKPQLPEPQDSPSRKLFSIPKLNKFLPKRGAQRAIEELERTESKEAFPVLPKFESGGVTVPLEFDGGSKVVQTSHAAVVSPASQLSTLGLSARAANASAPNRQQNRAAVQTLKFLKRLPEPARE